MLPRRLGAALQLVDRHVRRLKDGVLAVVQRPVARQDAALGHQPLVQPGVRERRDDRETRQVDFRLHRELGRLAEDVRFVVVQAEHEAPLQCDVVRMQPFDDAAEMLGGVEPLPAAAQVLRRDRFQPHQQPAAPAPGGHLQQRLVVGQQHRCQPVPLHAKRHERGEQPHGVVAVGDQVQVDEDQLAAAVPADVGHDVGDGLLQRLATPRGGHDAEVAVVDAPTRRLEHGIGDVPVRRQQVAAGERLVGQIEVRRLVVPRSQLPGGEVAEQPRPRFLGVPDDDCIRVRPGVVGDERDVRPAKDDGDALRPEPGRQLVRPRGGAGDDGQADQVHVEPVGHVGDPLVDQRQLGVQLRRHQRRQRGQRERLVPERPLEDPAAVAVQRPLGRDQRDAQPAAPLGPPRCWHGWSHLPPVRLDTAASVLTT